MNTTCRPFCRDYLAAKRGANDLDQYDRPERTGSRPRCWLHRRSAVAAGTFQQVT
jgi:hypothetical protein